jgi:hypothetical protein
LWTIVRTTTHRFWRRVKLNASKENIKPLQNLLPFAPKCFWFVWTWDQMLVSLLLV